MLQSFLKPSFVLHFWLKNRTELLHLIPKNLVRNTTKPTMKEEQVHTEDNMLYIELAGLCISVCPSA